MYIYIYLYIYIYMYIYIYVCIYIYIYTSRARRACICWSITTCANAVQCMRDACVHACKKSSTYTHTCIGTKLRKRETERDI